MMNRKDKHPFIVYAVDAPEYPGFDTVYSRKEPSPTVTGSLVVISGGHIVTDPDTGDEEVFLYGCMSLLGDIGCRFTEQVIAQLVQPEEHIMIICPVVQDDWAEVRNMRAAGFETTVAMDTVPGCSSTFAVCTGRGDMLRKFAWLMGGYGYAQFALFASHGPSYFEDHMVCTAQVGLNPIDVAADIIAEVDAHPERIPEKFGNFNLLAWLTDSHANSMKINRQSTDVSGMGMLLGNVAAGLGVPLYNAGMLQDPDEYGHLFMEFRDYEDWRPIPRHWRRVV